MVIGSQVGFRGWSFHFWVGRGGGGGEEISVKHDYWLFFFACFLLQVIILILFLAGGEIFFLLCCCCFWHQNSLQLTPPLKYKMADSFIWSFMVWSNLPFSNHGKRSPPKKTVGLPKHGNKMADLHKSHCMKTCACIYLQQYCRHCMLVMI